MNPTTVASSSNATLENKFRSMLNEPLNVGESKTPATNTNSDIPPTKKKSNVPWFLITFCIFAVVVTQIPKTWWVQTFGGFFGIKHIKYDDKSSNDVAQEEDSDNEENVVETINTIQELDPLTTEEIEDENFQAIESN